MTDATRLRYYLYVAENSYGDQVVEHVAEPDGEWVKYTDHAALTERLRAMEDERKPTAENAHVCHACDGTGWTYG